MGVQTTFYPVTTQTVSYDASVATSNAVGSQTYNVRIVADTAVHYALGGSPTATTSDPYLPADTVEYVAIKPGQKVAFIKNATAGTAYVTEVTQ